MSGKQQDPPPLQFPTLETFVSGLIAVIYELPTDRSQTITWCPKWWLHDGAVFRLTALWQAWENMHVNEGPQAAAKWLTFYADPIMDRLLRQDGPFASCTSDRGHEPERPHQDAKLPCTPPPEGLFTPREL
ncbi:DUF4913 domain-containing protein [Actinomyces succiniciruminis]|uniref:DUF4913 domain-containing protein n=1 Tax=Actinomyces succiniciruminis TaxID=1522002 RepID=A0A1L7RJX2_9ACTO|nr:DUF4913 domain-containing protein [Actinomyces succiniciruminis]CED91299.1 Hypothetical protein AAM4_1467 [Actinomyces succiniciruminis]